MSGSPTAPIIIVDLPARMGPEPARHHPIPGPEARLYRHPRFHLAAAAAAPLLPYHRRHHPHSPLAAAVAAAAPPLLHHHHRPRFPPAAAAVAAAAGAPGAWRGGGGGAASWHAEQTGGGAVPRPSDPSDGAERPAGGEGQSVVYGFLLNVIRDRPHYGGSNTCGGA